MQHQHQHPPHYASKLPSALFVSPQLYSTAATALWNHPQPPQLSPEDDQLDEDEDDEYSDSSSDEQDRIYDDVIEEDDDEPVSAHTNFAPLTSAHTVVPDVTTTTEDTTQRVEDLFEDVARAYAEMVCWLWFSHPTDHFNPTSLQRQLQPTEHFVEWLRRVITMTQLSSTVVILSLHYLTKLKKPRNAPGNDNTHSSLFDSVNPARGSEYLVAVVALMLANKVMDDNTYTNKSWAWMCGANLEQINAAEREFLVATRHELHVDQNMLNAWKYVLLGHVKARASRVASVQAVSLQPQARSTQSQPRQPILRARSASPEPGQFTFTAAHPRRAAANPPARRTARPASYVGPPPPTQHWLLSDTPSRPSTGVKRSAEAAFSPRSLAAPIPHPNERIRQATQAMSAVPIPPARRVYAPAVSRRIHPPAMRSGAPHHPPVEFHFAQMTLSNSNHGTPLYPTPPAPSPPGASVPQLAMPHVPTRLPNLDSHSAPPLQFYQLVQGGRILRAATPVGGRSTTAAQPPQLAVRIPVEHYRCAAPLTSRCPYSAGPSPIARCEGPGCKSHSQARWSSQLQPQPQPRTEQPLSSGSDSSMQLYPQQHPRPSFATPSPQAHTTLPPCRTLLYPSATAESPMSVYTPPQAQAQGYPYSQRAASPALVAEYAQFANAGSPGFQWASAPSSSSTVYRERPSSGAFYSPSSPLSHYHMSYPTQSAYPTRTLTITPLQQQYVLKQQQQQQQQASRTIPYDYTALPQQQSATSATQVFRSPVGFF